MTYPERSIEELKELSIQLKEQNEEYRVKIEEIKEYWDLYDELFFKEVAKGERYARRGSHYSCIRFLPDAEKWKETVYWKYKKELEELGQFSIMKLPERWVVDNNFVPASWHKPFLFDVKLYCDGFFPTEEGICFHGIDPFGEMTTKPFKEVSIEEAESYIGRIIKVDMVMERGISGYTVTGVTPLPYNLYEKLEE